MLKELMFWTVRDRGEAPGAEECRKTSHKLLIGKGIFESRVSTILQQAI